MVKGSQRSHRCRNLKALPAWSCCTDVTQVQSKIGEVHLTMVSGVIFPHRAL